MKSTFRIIVVVLVATFYGCQKSDVSPGVSSSVTIDGVFSGTIVDDSNRIDSIKAYANIVDSYNVVVGENILGKSTVLSSGKFSLVLTNPVLRKLGNGPSGVVVSDTTAIVGNVSEFEAFKSGTYIGYISKTNISIGDSTKLGESDSQFMYSDRTFTIKGTEISDTIYSGISYNSKYNYNITFKKGWNEIVFRVDSYSHTSTGYTEVDTFSNAVTADLQWRFFLSNPSSVRAKARGIKRTTRTGFLMRSSFGSILTNLLP